MLVHGYEIKPRADLGEADLRGADLEGANLGEANLRGADLPAFQIPQSGALEVWKKCRNGVIVLLTIPPEARRTASLVGRKCRAEYAVVTKVFGADVGVSLRSREVAYICGETVYPDKYDDDIRVECTHGIHFFLTRDEAETWNG